jgi:hypothetical protein
MILARAIRVECSCAAVEPIGVLESTFMWSEALLKSNMPFSNPAGGITDFLQPFRQCRNFAWYAEIGSGILLGTRIVLKPESVLVHSSE